MQNNGIFHIAIKEKGSEDADLCTASKIGPESFLTAAHCFDNHKIYSVMLSAASKNPDFEFEPIFISKVNIHPSYKSDEETNFAQSDIAIVTVKPSTDFSKLNSLKLSFKDVASNTSVQIWGFGCQESLNKLDSYYPIKKSFETTVEEKSSLMSVGGYLGETIAKMVDDIFNSNFSTPGRAKSDKEASFCFGDSGGPVLQNGKIIGVNAEAFMADLNEKGESPSGISYLNQHTRISSLKKWFLEILKTN